MKKHPNQKSIFSADSILQDHQKKVTAWLGFVAVFFSIASDASRKRGKNLACWVISSAKWFLLFSVRTGSMCACMRARGAIGEI
jgi:hypothetical protein